MNRKRIIISIVVLLLVIAMAVVAFLFISTKPTPKNEPTPFSNIIENPIPTKEASQSTQSSRKVDFTNPVKDYLASVSAVFELEKANKPLPPWDYKTTRFYALVYDIAFNDGKLVLYTVVPKDGVIGSVYKTVTSTCTKEQTASFLYDMTILDTNFDLMSNVVKGDYLSSFCMNENCDTIGKECVLIKGIK